MARLSTRTQTFLEKEYDGSGINQNVQLVRAQGVRIVYRMPADVRKVLNQAVKAGLLGHIKKDGLLPEAYYHPNSQYKALEERERIANRGIVAISKCMVSDAEKVFGDL